VLLVGGLLVPSLSRAAFTEQGATVLGGVNYSARSVSLADIDNDGDLDAFFQGSASSTRQILRNNLIGTGTFTFTNVTSTWLPSGIGSSWSAAWGDYNGDGKIDVFVGQENSGIAGDLLRNTGSSLFNESSNNGVLNDPGFHQNVGWVDIDNDHDLDLLIGMEGPNPTDPKHAVYLQNWTTHTFTNVGAAVGFQAAEGIKAYGMAIGDSDGDGDLDVYISTCRADNNIRNNFYKNMLKETGSLSFVDIADTNGTQFMQNSYGTEFVDFDNDGDLDLYMTGADTQPTKIWRNDGNNQFTDIDTITGHPVLSSTGRDLNGSKAVDYDNDGDLDLYFHDNLSGTGVNHKLFRNDGNWQFTEVTATEGLDTAAGGAPVGAGGYDSVWADLDRDGDQDLIDPNNTSYSPDGQTVIQTPERFFRNDASTNGNKWLYVDLIGPNWNTTGIGSSLYATMEDGSLNVVTLRREANTNIDTFNQSDLPVHFGLGTATHVEWLRVVWPDGTVQFLHDVAPNQYLQVSYSGALQGDFNGDGSVDSADYVVWRENFGAPFTIADYNLWRAHFGQSAPVFPAAAGVPEPASTWLATTALLAFVPLRALKRRKSAA